ncbi:acetolactate decarboxylase [Microbulbifer halophilus]|uniref:Alpha-acetolactate decarboxylase n=1 Tax=Microbulbifer halophilus TaxID=453963 RepID=A0ABW5E6P6_9GAMM|nr:acetolactate decarboxylase [Microbulbifer halophilus]MCW8127271.1 acetolactate decarboxylase [Microbulbifer halophilus]
MLKYLQKYRFATIAAILLSPPAVAEEKTDYRVDDALYQLAPTAVLAQGLYEGPTPFRELLRFGDFGLGGINPIDGEIIIVDGAVYHASHRGGKLREVGPGEKSPFAYIKRFREDRRIALPAAESLEELERAIDRRLPTPNLIYALRIEGVFDYLKLRSVPRQKPPYPSIDEVVKGQSVYERTDTPGTIVALRFPPYLGGATGSGFHMHFVDAERRLGGHVLDLRSPALSVPVDESRGLHLILPDSPAFEEADFSAANDSSGAYERAVRPRSGE